MTARLLLAATAAAAAFAVPAAAQVVARGRPVPPHQNLVVVQVRRVDLPDPAPGDCRVAGVVAKVVAGQA